MLCSVLGKLYSSLCLLNVFSVVKLASSLTAQSHLKLRQPDIRFIEGSS